MVPTRLENLPDEILIEICLYLSTVEVLNIFGELNTRLDRTISQFRHDINLQYLTFHQVQRCCSHLIPLHAEHIVKLTLNTWYSPGEISLFNQSIASYGSLQDLLPALKQLWLINFSNNDIDILPQILFIEKVMIDIDAQMPLSHSTKLLLDQYLFCTPNAIKELRLYGAEEGLLLQHHVPLTICEQLEKLIISVATLDDFILLFQRAPNLVKLHVEINLFSSDAPRQYATVDMMPKRLTDFHLWLKDKRLLLFDDLSNILTTMPTIERLSLEIETNDIEYSRGNRWKEVFSSLPKLSRLDMGLKIWMDRPSTSNDMKNYVEVFAQNNLEVCCYADTRMLFIDTIPYDYDISTGVMTSPRSSQAQSTNTKLFQQRARRVNTLCFDGRHELTTSNDWLQVITRFPDIQVLDMVSINISKEMKAEDTLDRYAQLRLPNLNILRYIRSTKCEVHLPFFLYLADNILLAPRLRTLTMMYGDMIYLCKRLPTAYSFSRFKELCLYGNGADGLICLKDVDLVVQCFPNLEHFWLHTQSSRTINRHVQSITRLFFRLLSKLNSFRVSCKRDSLRLPAFQNKPMSLAWLKDVCGFADPERIYLTIGKKEIAIWK